MAITGKFEADFQAFHQAIDQAVQKLRTMEQQGDQMSVGVTRSMTQITASSETTTTGFGRFAGALQHADKTLATMGVNLSTEIQAIKEIGEASGKTATEIGLIGTAGLAAGAALAGWKIGRLVADFFDLDKAIGNTTAKLLGFGDVAAEVAGAKQDSLALATQRAGRAVTDYGEAIRINTEWVKKHAEESKKAEKVYADWKAAVDEITAGGTSWRDTLETIDSETVESAKVFLEAGYSVKTLADYFGLSERQIKAVEVALKADKEEIAAVNAAVKELGDAWAETDKIMRDFAVKTHAIAMNAMREEAAEQKRLMNERNASVIDGLNQIRAAEKQLADFTLAATLSSTDAQIAKIREAAAAEIEGFKGTAEQKEIFTLRKNQLTELEVSKVEQGSTTINTVSRVAAEESGNAFERAWMKSAAAFEQFKGIVVAGTGILSDLMAVTDAGSWAERNRQILEAQRQRGDIFLTGMSSGRLPIQTRQFGGAVSAGQPYIVGERGPELFRPTASGSIVPTGGGQPIMVQLVVDGRVLAEVVQQHTTRSVMRNTKLG